jgi:hypothetical protein
MLSASSRIDGSSKKATRNTTPGAVSQSGFGLNMKLDGLRRATGDAVGVMEFRIYTALTSSWRLAP